MRTPLSVALIALFAASATAEEVNVYSSRHYNTDQALYDEFTESTGITVKLIEAKGDALIERMIAEGESSPADVFITVDGSRIARAVEAGLYQPTSSESLTEAVPENLRHPEGLWFGLSTRVRGIVYNQSLVASMIASDGLEAAESWANGIVANMARDPQGGDTDQIKAVAVGECDVAVANHYYLARLMRSDDAADQEVAEAVDIIFPNQDGPNGEGRGTHANVSAAGVAAHAPNKDAAVQFIEYLATPSAQAYFADGNNEYPVVEGVKLSPVLDAWGAFKTDAIAVIAYGENNAEALKAMDRAGWQ